MLGRLVGFGVLTIIAAAIVIQLVPYGRDHTDPPGTTEPKWDSPQTRQLAAVACFDCHSNETVWPWYSSVAPMSWLIQRDVEEGRQRLNFSTWDKPQGEARGAAREVQRGTMPPSYYILLHPAAGLSADQKNSLVQGIQTTVAAGAPPAPAGGSGSRR